MNSPKLIVGAITAATLGLMSCTSDRTARESDFARDVTSRQVSLPSQLPPMKAFTTAKITRPMRSNAEIGRDFLELSFQLESGRILPVLSRFEGPITLRVSGRSAPALDQDLSLLLARLNNEAGIKITRVAADQPASINLEVVSKNALNRLVPGAACFVAPNVASWSEYKTARGTERTDWTKLTERTQMSIFMPGDVAPQEMRDCLHEEIAQALGPVNDLYRLSDSVFNDDNFHTVLTGFDMLILRAYYAPELRSGMTSQQVQAKLPALLARLNPAGGYQTPAAAALTPRAWTNAIEDALSAKNGIGQRRSAADRAVTIARNMGWRDTRLAFSLFAQGRLNLGYNSDIALASFREAESLYRALPGNDLQAAHMGVQLAAHALSMGNANSALNLVERHITPVQSAQNAALLSTLLMIKAEAMALQGRDAEAQLVRLDSLGWARYGFGSEREVSQRLDEIAAISPRTRG